MGAFVDGSFELTNRQLEVLKLIADGLKNEDIARRLFITKHTVKAHICSLYEIFDVNCRVTLVNKALKYGIISLNNVQT